MIAKLFVLLIVVVSVSAFAPVGRMSAARTTMVSGKDLAKVVGATGAAVSLMGGAAFAKEGASPKQGFFGIADNSYSSPYASGENREDPLYSPYSPYGNGDAAVYKEGQSDEVKFWTNQLNNCM